MKAKYITVAAVMLVCGSLLTTSCIGSFTLTNKLLAWNKTVGNKFVNEVVFFAFWVLPVYEISSLADVLVLNSIEFWSGNNPVAQGRKVIDGNDGRYLVDCDGKGYTITSENDGSVVRLDFHSDVKTWTVTAGKNTYDLIEFVDDTHVRVPTLDGTRAVVELSQQGVWAYSQSVQSAMLALK